MKLSRRSLPRARWALGLLGLATAAAMTAAAQWSSGLAADAPVLPNPTYDGRYTFVRLRHRNLVPDRPFPCYRSEDGPGWRHDYPRAERNLLQILGQITSLDGRQDSTMVLTADDPSLLEHPFAYVAEAGCWQPTDAEIRALRTYLLKGGFLFVDDLTYGGDVEASWYGIARDSVASYLSRVLPSGKFVQLKANASAFNTFFQIDPDKVQRLPVAEAPAPTFFGIYEDNDPSKRLLVLVAAQTAAGHFWRWAGQGLYPVDEGNEAYKLGVNFVLYGLTH